MKIGAAVDDSWRASAASGAGDGVKSEPAFGGGAIVVRDAALGSGGDTSAHLAANLTRNGNVVLPLAGVALVFF